MNNSRYFSSTPPVVLNLIIINALMLLATELLPVGNRIVGALALFNVESPLFHSYQLVTYMFLHGGFSHLFFNMFALWMFGRTLEYELGSKRFLTYYMVCGVGAGVLQLLVGWLEYRYGNVGMMALMVPTVGASGAVFGLLLAFGVMHPNAVIMLLIPPIPMKAKWFVVVYGVIELFFGISGRMDGVAHFAHVGGMLWGFLLLYYWKHKGVIAAVISVLVLAKVKHLSAPQIFDTIAMALLNGQMLGRWGNFFNREAFGGYTDSLFAMRLPLDAVRSSDVTEQMRRHIERIDGVSYIQVHPTFLYESLWCMVLLIILFAYRKHKKYEGELFLMYLFGYGLGRFWIEGLRTDQLLLPGVGIAVSQLLAGAIVVGTGAAMLYLRKKHKNS